MSALQLNEIGVRSARPGRECCPLGSVKAVQIVREIHSPEHSKTLSKKSIVISGASISHRAKCEENARMDVKQMRRANLIALIKEAGNAARLAKLTGKDPNQFSQIVGKKPIRNIGDELARDLEKSMRKPHGWMDHDHSAEGRENTARHNLPYRAIHEISWAQAGSFNGVNELGSGARTVYTTANVGPNAFALKVRGDSMANSAGRSYPDGCTIIVDPSKVAKPGDRIIVKMNDAEEATFKQLEFDGQTYFLKPLNPRYPIVPMPKDARIIGVIVQTLVDE